MQEAANGPEFMCARCIDDADLRAIIRANATSHECSFCGRSSASRPIAAEAEAVVQLIADYIGQEYEDAAEMVPYESAEGGYQADTKSTDDILRWEIGLEEANAAAWQYIIDNLPDVPWVQKDFFSLHPYDKLRFGWSQFAEAVKHQTRYLFFEPRPHPRSKWQPEEGIRPEEMLDELGAILREARRVRTLKAGTVLYRVRIHGADESPSTLADLGPPPAEAAIYANRLSPAGISMLYTAEDEATAVKETVDASKNPEGATIATFTLERDVRVVDLVKLRRVPLFNTTLSQEERARLLFAHTFAREVRREIVKDGREHIEYVPTQVVTEYLRFRFRSGGKAVEGLRYGSARNNGGVNVALFFGKDDVAPIPIISSSPAPVALVGICKISLP